MLRLEMLVDDVDRFETLTSTALIVLDIVFFCAALVLYFPVDPFCCVSNAF